MDIDIDQIPRENWMLAAAVSKDIERQLGERMRGEAVGVAAVSGAGRSTTPTKARKTDEVVARLARITNFIASMGENGGDMREICQGLNMSGRPITLSTLKKDMRHLKRSGVVTMSGPTGRGGFTYRAATPRAAEKS